MKLSLQCLWTWKWPSWLPPVALSTHIKYVWEPPAAGRMNAFLEMQYQHVVNRHFLITCQDRLCPLSCISWNSLPESSEHCALADKAAVAGKPRRILIHLSDTLITISFKFLQLGSRAVILTFKRRIKSRLPFAGIIRSSPYSILFQDKG
jgi:hypothetical protein